MTQLTFEQIVKSQVLTDEERAWHVHSYATIHLLTLIRNIINVSGESPVLVIEDMISEMPLFENGRQIDDFLEQLVGT